MFRCRDKINNHGNEGAYNDNNYKKLAQTHVRSIGGVYGLYLDVKKHSSDRKLYCTYQSLGKLVLPDYILLCDRNGIIKNVKMYGYLFITVSPAYIAILTIGRINSECLFPQLSGSPAPLKCVGIFCSNPGNSTINWKMT